MSLLLGCRALPGLRGLASSGFLLLSLFSVTTAQAAGQPAAPSSQTISPILSSQVPKPQSQSLQDLTHLVTSYRKANEILSFHGLYLKDKISEAKSAHAASQLPGADLAKWKTDLQEISGGFCLNGETENECYNRYVTVQGQTLAEIQAEVVRNHLSIAELQEQGALKTSGAIRATAFEPSSKSVPSEKLPYRMRPLSSAELQAHYKAEEKRLQILTSPQFMEWVNGIAREPAKEDFVKLKKKAAGNTDEDQFELDLNCANPEGGVCYDLQRYQSALEDFRQKKQPNLEKIKDELALHQNEMISPAKVRTPIDVKNFAGKRSISSYETAAGAIEQAIQQAAKNGGENVYITADPTVADPELLRIP